MTLAVECTLADKTVRTRCLTLGGGGLFLELSVQLAPDTELMVRFHPAKHHPLVEAHGKVRYWLPGQGIGLEFTHILPGDRQRILRLILHRLGARRKHPRRRFVTQIEHGEGAFLGFSMDISAGGTFVEMNEPMPDGSKLKLRLNLDDGGPAVVVTAEVRYGVERVGVGVQFVDLSPDDRNRIDVVVTRGETSAPGP